MPVGAERQRGLQIGNLATVRPAVRSLSVCARSAFLVVAEASQLRLAPNSKRLVTLARGLSPAFLRFGGKRTDFLQFQNLRNPAKSRGGPGPDYYLKNYEDDIVRSDVALDKQKGCKIAQHPDIMLELQREKAAQMHLVLLKEQFSNTYSNLILTGFLAFYQELLSGNQIVLLL
ncbi:inactive heparanase-2-like [Microtus pennsylvanicus]|uniref:inactive heparanase-2-like n=1 Tax=Microtus pennsylvanicus TaxID=10058 RepID=UPI003F6C9384